MPVLFYRFLLIFTFFLRLSSVSAQTLDIENAEKTLLAVRKDSNDLRTYNIAIFDLKKAYRAYLIQSFQKEQQTCATCHSDSADLAEKTRVLQELTLPLSPFQKDSLLDETRGRDTVLWFLNQGIDELVGYCLKNREFSKSLNYRTDNYQAYMRMGDSTSINFINRTVSYASGMTFLEKFEAASTLLEKILPLAHQHHNQMQNVELYRFRTNPKAKNEWGLHADYVLAQIYSELGDTYKAMGNWEKVKNYYLQSRKLYETASSVIFENEALNKQRSPTKFLYLHHKNEVMLAFFLLSESRYDEALLNISQLEAKIEVWKKKFPSLYSNDFTGHIACKVFALMYKGDMQALKPFIYSSDTLSTLVLEPLYLTLIGQPHIALQKVDSILNNMNGKAKMIGKLHFMSKKIDILRVLGDYKTAKNVSHEAIEMFDNPDVTISQKISIFSSYAIILELLGLKEQALSYRLQCFDYKKQILPANSSAIAKEWKNLGIAYLGNQRYDSAQICFQKARPIFEQTVGVQNWQYLNILANLTELYYKTNDFTKAEVFGEQLFQLSQTMQNSLVGLNPKISIYLPVLLAHQKIQKAKKLLSQLWKEAWLVTTDSSNFRLLKYQRFAIQIAAAEKNTQNLLQNTEAWLKHIRQYIERNISYLPDGEKTQFLENLATEFAAVASVLSQNTEGGKYLFDMALLQKGVALADTRSFQQRIMQLPDDSSRYQAALLAAKMKSIDNDQTAAEMRIRFNHEADSLRALLKAAHPQLFAADWVHTHWQDVQKQLKDGEIAIEFLDFDFLSNSVPTNKHKYCALVLGKTGEPSVINLFEESQLQTLLDSAAAKEKSGEQRAVTHLYTENGQKISKLLWQPLEKAKRLRGVKTVYYAPSGLLHRLSFAALPHPTETGLLSDRYHFVAMNSSRDIGSADSIFEPRNSTALLLGGIEYRYDTAKIMAAHTAFAPSEGMRSIGPSSFRACNIGFLKNSLYEVQAIDTVFKQKKGQSTQVLTHFDASEDAFRAACAQKITPTILHLSTHGVYDSTSQFSLTPQQALHRNYVLLAGCEGVLCLEKRKPTPFHDGVLTAAEIAQMNLSTTQLVVLSACQTGLGDIKGREGVYGLSRGFKLAGARYTLTSLWAVDDAATATYMHIF